MMQASNSLELLSAGSSALITLAAAGWLDEGLTALTRAPLTARSQLSTATDFIDTRRGGVGTDAVASAFFSPS